ncbi:MAG: hypothetical protein U1F77_19010, partial [Kiritimatiellia bacterium]
MEEFAGDEGGCAVEVGHHAVAVVGPLAGEGEGEAVLVVAEHPAGLLAAVVLQEAQHPAPFARLLEAEDGLDGDRAGGEGGRGAESAQGGGIALAREGDAAVEHQRVGGQAQVGAGFAGPLAAGLVGRGGVVAEEFR